MNKISFQIENIHSDVITAVNGTPLAENVLAKDFVYDQDMGAYWIEKSLAGLPELCTNLPDFANQELTMQREDESNYTVERCDFIGGHPIHRPPYAV